MKLPHTVYMHGSIIIYTACILCVHACTHRVLVQLVPIYLAEIAPKQHRGKLVSLSIATGTVGALVIIISSMST